VGRTGNVVCEKFQESGVWRRPQTSRKKKEKSRKEVRKLAESKKGTGGIPGSRVQKEGNGPAYVQGSKKGFGIPEKKQKNAEVPTGSSWSAPCRKGGTAPRTRIGRG